MGGPSPPGAGTILPANPGGFHAEPPSVFRSAGAYRDVPDRGTGHSDDHGMAEVPPQIPSLLHLRRDVSRPSGRPRGAASGPHVRTAPRGDPSGRGIPLALSPLCRAYGVPHGRMRRRGPLRRPLYQREGPRDRPREDDGKLWRGRSPPGPGGQTRGGTTRAGPVRVSFPTPPRP